MIRHSKDRPLEYGYAEYFAKVCDALLGAGHELAEILVRCRQFVPCSCWEKSRQFDPEYAQVSSCHTAHARQIPTANMQLRCSARNT